MDSDDLEELASPNHCNVSNVCPPPPCNKISISAPSTFESEPPNAQKPLSKPHTPYIRHSPYSAPWVMARLRDSPDRAIPVLRNWAHTKRYREVNDLTIRQI